MPWLILFFAALYFAAAWQGSDKIGQLNGYLQTDLPNYGKFALMIVVIWALGIWPPARKPATLLLGLILVSIAIAGGGGFFTNLQNLTVPSGTTSTAPSQIQSGVGGSTSSGDTSSILGAAGTILGGQAVGDTLTSGISSGISDIFSVFGL